LLSILFIVGIPAVGMVVDLRKNESVPVDPVWILRVKGHEFVEEDMGNRGHAHGGAGMAGVRFESGIDLIVEENVSHLF
jgi:hypothetical protein